MWHFEAHYFNWTAEDVKTIHIEVNDYGQEVSERDMWILAVEKPPLTQPDHGVWTA